jgi:hypothetical protein
MQRFQRERTFWYGLVKIIIPGSAAHEIDYSLSVAGIDEITIFPIWTACAAGWLQCCSTNPAHS